MLPKAQIFRVFYNSAHFWSAFFILNLTFFVIFFVPYILSGNDIIQKEAKKDNEEWSFGGPFNIASNNSNIDYSYALLGISDVQRLNNDINASLINDGSFFGTTNPQSSFFEIRNGIKKYKIQKGDTISELALKFDISEETIKWANPALRYGLKIAQTVTILPVSGVVHEIRNGETLISVSEHYRINGELVKKYNQNYQELFDKPGSLIVIPYGHPISNNLALIASLKDMRYYFTLPARGWNWGELHPENAVDIAGNCGTLIYAAAEGLVIEAQDEGYWNQGYGNYILIEHPNGTQTRYAHTKENIVKTGDYVQQGQEIAKMGSTGKTHGPTGCHLHFEVIGAKNPFTVK